MQWIKCLDRLPNHGDIVPVICKGDIFYCFFNENKFYFHSHKNVLLLAITNGISFGDHVEVTHWLELPELSKE